HLGGRRRRVGKARGELLAYKAMLCVGLPVDVEGEVHEGAKALLALPQSPFRPLALGQIEHETDTLVPIFPDPRRADQRWHAAAILAEILSLIRVDRSCHLQLDPCLRMSVEPFRRRQVRPADATRDEIFTV